MEAYCSRGIDLTRAVLYCSGASLLEELLLGMCEHFTLHLYYTLQYTSPTTSYNTITSDRTFWRLYCLYNMHQLRNCILICKHIALAGDVVSVYVCNLRYLQI